MNQRAESIRVMHPLFHVGQGGSIPTSALQLRFSETTEATFVGLNGEWHSRLPRIGNSHFRACFKAEHDGVIYAVAAWSNPVARLLPQRTWLELRRFAIAPDAPRYTASRMLGWMTRQIAKMFPDVVRLISYQDCHAHRGTIYKASGWHQAENYTSRPRGWKPLTGWASRHRAGRTDQALAPRMRWELDVGAL